MKLIPIKHGDIRGMMGMSQQEWSMGFAQARQRVNIWASDLILENSFTEEELEEMFNEEDLIGPFTAEEFMKLLFPK